MHIDLNWSIRNEIFNQCQLRTEMPFILWSGYVLHIFVIV